MIKYGYSKYNFYNVIKCVICDMCLRMTPKSFTTISNEINKFRKLYKVVTGGYFFN